MQAKLTPHSPPQNHFQHMIHLLPPICEPVAAPPQAVCHDCGIRMSLVTNAKADPTPRCPACQRIHDRLPEGFLIFRGQLFREQREQILGFAHACYQIASENMGARKLRAIEDLADDVTLITFADRELPITIGRAASGTFGGELQILREQSRVRVYWNC